MNLVRLAAGAPHKDNFAVKPRDYEASALPTEGNEVNEGAEKTSLFPCWLRATGARLALQK
jgi:hypothetical protein